MPGAGETKLPIAGLLILFVGVAMVAYGVTALWFGMRDVMEVGGYCAEGGPYEIRQTCPDRSELLMFTGIPVGVIGLFVAVVGAAKSGRGAGGLLWLSWPALFISLGYNFIDYAINPPEGMGSTAGWWVCGILFGLMGIPALFGIPWLCKGIERTHRTAIVATFLLAAVAGLIVGIYVADSAA